MGRNPCGQVPKSCGNCKAKSVDAVTAASEWQLILEKREKKGNGDVRLGATWYIYSCGTSVQAGYTELRV